ncbi:MAG: histidinol-phosphatase [Hyphomonadaceae bacterium]
MTRLSAAQIEPYRAFADELAEAARAAILPFFRAGHSIENKSAAGFDPVTEADKAGERAMRALIAQRFPDHGVLGEEEDIKPGQNDFTWYLDPIDGTRAFIAGLPLWGVLIALAHEGRPIVGVIDQPYLGERFRGWLAPDGSGAALETRAGVRPLRVRACAGLLAARISTTDPTLFPGDELAAFTAVRTRAQLTRYGYDCYAYAMVAAGGLDAVIESRLGPWDAAALIPVIEGAGGAVTDWRGQAVWRQEWFQRRDGRGQVLAAGDRSVQADILPLLASAAK